MSVGMQYGSTESVGKAESECRESRREGFGVGVRKHSGSR
jgi:hypothetical protein